MKVVAETSYYTLSVFPKKNRILVKMKGNWRKRNVPHYIEDWKKALKKIQPGFTIIADLRDTGSQSRGAMKTHRKVLDLTQKAGCIYSAEVNSELFQEGEVDLEMMYRDFNINNIKVTTPEKAHHYLDMVKFANEE